MSHEENRAHSKGEETVMGTEESKAGSTEMRGVDQTRRALIRAGWVLPAVLALQLQLPSTVLAQYAHTDIHIDNPHVANIHSDIHSDIHIDNPHIDNIHSDIHIDNPHIDNPHIDNIHSDSTHLDAHSDSHVDSTFDVVHTDFSHLGSIP